MSVSVRVRVSGPHDVDLRRHGPDERGRLAYGVMEARALWNGRQQPVEEEVVLGEPLYRLNQVRLERQSSRLWLLRLMLQEGVQPVDLAAEATQLLQSEDEGDGEGRGARGEG